jgi:hypothetical protein
MFDIKIWVCKYVFIRQHHEAAALPRGGMNTQDIDEIISPGLDKRIVALRQRIGWLSRLIDVGSALFVIGMTAFHILMRNYREEGLRKFLEALGLDPAIVSDFANSAIQAMLFVLIGLYAILFLAISRLTHGYLSGDVFSVAATERLRRVAFAGFAVAAFDVLGRLCIGLLISTELFAKAPIFFWIAPIDLALALFSILVLGLATIFRTAVVIAAEHSEIV